jgi:cell division protein FtsI/penicillin-binding protein 2
MTFEEIIWKSSNIGMAIIGMRMGNPQLHEIVTRFGFGSPTGVDFPGERVGGVNPLSMWNSYTTSSMPMGHEVAVSPLQLITAFSAFANDGLLLRPRICRALLGPDGEVEREFTGPVVVRRVMPAETARYFRDTVLAGVITDGGGHRAALEDFRVFGKTGTAQVPYGIDKATGKRKRKGYEPNAYLGSFVGGAPLKDPQLVVLVMVYMPDAKRGYYGGLISAPAVQRILQESLAYMQISPEGDGVAKGN